MHIEEKFKTHMQVRDIMVLLQGKTDRIDRYNQVMRIIDYKTGSVDKKKLKIEAADQLFMSQEYDKAFQLMFYRLLFDNLKKSSSNLITGILSLRKISDGLNVVETEDVNVLMKDFRIKLNALLEKLLDEHGVFEQTDDIDVCAYCNYKNICMK
jgi:ATP-dependent helicase/DNAse subunit B